MQYMLLIYASESDGPFPETPEFGPYMQAYFEFTEKMKAEGKLIGGEALQGVASATTVTMRDGKVHTMDGPFAETKEQLGGFYILECKDLDEAIACAAMIPDAANGRVEVRPLMIFD